MAVPKKKTSKSRRNQRRSHDALARINVIIDKDTGEDKLLLGEVETNGVAFFRKLIVNQEIDNVCLAVRVKERNDIAQFVKDIKLKPRKKRDMAVKKTKSLDLEIEV